MEKRSLNSYLIKFYSNVKLYFNFLRIFGRKLKIINLKFSELSYEEPKHL